MPLESMNQTEPVSMENDIGTPINASATIIMIINQIIVLPPYAFSIVSGSKTRILLRIKWMTVSTQPTGKE